MCVDDSVTPAAVAALCAMAAARRVGLPCPDAFAARTTFPDHGVAWQRDPADDDDIDTRY